jgi:tetratricopeptide (TPR) repeat protein
LQKEKLNAWYMKKTVCIMALLIPFAASAQYSDHRGKNIDSLEHCLKIGKIKGVELAQTYLELAWGYSETDAEKMRDYSIKGIAVTQPLNEPGILAELYDNLATSYYYISQHDTALIYYEKALEAVDKMAADKRYKSAAVDRKRAMIEGDIGNLYNIQGKNHTALIYYFKALSVYEKLPQEKNTAIVYGNMGDCYLGMKNYEQAELYFSKKANIAQELNDSLFLLDASAHLVSVYNYKKDYAKALEYAETAYNIAFAYSEATIEDKMYVLQCLCDVWAEGYQDYDQALQYAQAALQYAEQ